MRKKGKGGSYRRKERVKGEKVKNKQERQKGRKNEEKKEKERKKRKSNDIEKEIRKEKSRKGAHSHVNMSHLIPV